MKYQYPMDVVWGTLGIEYTVSLSGNGTHVDARSLDGRFFKETCPITDFETMIDRRVITIKPSKIEPITLQVQIEGLEKAVALAKELEAVLSRLKIVVN